MIKNDKLKRNISGFSAYMMVVGTIIGSGIFFKPSAVFRATGTAALGLIAWVLGGLIALCGGLTVAELGAMIPETGGMMTYIEKSYSKFFGFVLGWSQSVGYYGIRYAANGIATATQACALLGLSDKSIIPLAVIIIIFINIMNYIGNKATSSAISLATVIKFIPIIGISIFGIFFNPDPVKIRLLPITTQTHPFWQALSVSLMATIFATDGWINVTNIAGEIENPGKKLPRALFAGIGTVTLSYIIINLAYLRVLTPAQLASTATPASDVATILFGKIGGKILASCICISVFGSLTGFIRAGWRVPYALGLRNMLPFSTWFSKLSKKTNMPLNSGLFLLVITLSSIIGIKNYNTLTDIGSYVIWVFYTMTFISVFILRKKWPDKERPYKVPLYPVIPALAIIGGLFILISTTIYQTKIALLSLVLIGISLPIYYYKVIRPEKNKTVKE